MALSAHEKNPFFVHPSSIVETPASIGRGTKIWHFSHVMKGTHIGEDCVLGQNTFVASGVFIGNRVKIQNNVSLYEGVVLEDDVFIGPSVVFTNVINPRSFIPRRNEFRQTKIARGATIGANATVLCGLSVGRYAMVGAGAVLTKSISDNSLAIGNPAEVVGWVCRCGSRLRKAGEKGAGWFCPSCSSRYAFKEGIGLEPL